MCGKQGFSKEVMFGQRHGAGVWHNLTDIFERSLWLFYEECTVGKEDCGRKNSWGAVEVIRHVPKVACMHQRTLSRE